MNLAILHYHLNRGGVTRVIENQLTALDAVLDPGRPWRVAVVSGGRRQGWNEELAGRLRAIRLELVDVPALDYDNARAAGDDLLPHLRTALDELGFAPAETVLHVHNHSLGKNREMPPAVARLAEAGYGVLLQIHDFAEDFRSENYGQIVASGCPLLYPQAESVHYAVLNGRDFDVLQDAGVVPARLHFLPNPVPTMAETADRPAARAKLQRLFGVGPDARYVVYPVRCIRRKNVGEALLYAAMAPPEVFIALTLPPLNPIEVPIYRAWKETAGALGLPCLFEVGAPGALSFGENLAAADQIVTTSLAEGFGMVFLEAWLAGRSLLGRDLPEITRDFTSQGVRYAGLRPKLPVPVEWIGAEAFAEMTLAAYRRTLAAYDRPEPDDLDRQLQQKQADGLVDFGDLDEALQRKVLQTVCQSDARREELRSHNRWIVEALTAPVDSFAADVRHNAAVIDRHFSHEPSGRRLASLLQQVAASPRGGPPTELPDRSRILDRFLAFDRFRPIRS